MTTITLWLLVSIGSAATSPTVPIERFASRQDCVDAMAQIVSATERYRAPMACIQAKVVKP